MKNPLKRIEKLFKGVLIGHEDDPLREKMGMADLDPTHRLAEIHFGMLRQQRKKRSRTCPGYMRWHRADDPQTEYVLVFRSDLPKIGKMGVIREVLQLFTIVGDLVTYRLTKDRYRETFVGGMRFDSEWSFKENSLSGFTCTMPPLSYIVAGEIDKDRMQEAPIDILVKLYRVETQKEILSPDNIGVRIESLIDYSGIIPWLEMRAKQTTD